MITTLTIVLAVLIAVNVWLMIRTVNREKQCRKLLHERIEEFDEATELNITELQGAKLRVNEAMAEVEKIKKLYNSLLAKHEDLKLSYQRAKDELAALKQDPHAEPQDPVKSGELTAHDQPGEPACKPLKPKKATRKARK